MTTNFSYGVDAESLVIDYLKEKKYIILSNRYITPYGEIDIVACDQDKNFVFFEVKARKSYNNLGIAVSNRQVKRITNAALYFLSQQEGTVSDGGRFDVIYVHKDIIVEHIENAWNFDEVGY